MKIKYKGNSQNWGKKRYQIRNAEESSKLVGLEVPIVEDSTNKERDLAYEIDHTIEELWEFLYILQIVVPKTAEWWNDSALDQYPKNDLVYLGYPSYLPDIL